NGTWAFRLSCHISDQEEIAALREEAIHRGTGDQQDCLHSKTFSTVAKHWLNWQKTLPPDSAEKRADSTLAENEREVAQLIRAFGRRRVTAPAEAINAASLAFKKALIERALAGEMNHHLGYPAGATKPAAVSNQRNGKGAKTVLTEDGPIRIEVPRDRDGSFAPLLIPKHERRFTGFDDKIVAMYARGMTVREIQGFLLEQYATEVSPEFI